METENSNDIPRAEGNDTETATDEGNSANISEEPESGQSSSNINNEEVEPDVEKKLRGDAIGNTLYSERFVTKTLLELADIKWGEELEESLCFLWDMTTEKDVCEYLLGLSFPSIASSVISSNSENRLIEITIGIVANIYCICPPTDLTDEHVESILDYLGNDDPLILIQVIRFMVAISYRSEQLKFVTEPIMDQLGFILENSMNVELLENSLNALSTITSDGKIEEKLVKGTLVRSSVIAYQSIFKMELGNSYEIETTVQHKSLQYLMQIVNNVCCFINASSDDRLLNEVQENSDILLEEIVKLLKYYSVEENLLPFGDAEQFLFDTLTFVFQLLRVNYASDIFVPLITISSLVLKNNLEDTDTFLELICYLIGVGNVDNIKTDIKVLQRKEIVSILNEINAKKPYTESLYIGNFNILYAEYK